MPNKIICEHCGDRVSYAARLRHLRGQGWQRTKIKAAQLKENLTSALHYRFRKRKHPEESSDEEDEPLEKAPRLGAWFAGLHPCLGLSNGSTRFSRNGAGCWDECRRPGVRLGSFTGQGCAHTHSARTPD